MKKLLLTSFLFLIYSIGINATTVTSVANGNWSSPTTWGGVPPVPGNIVIINHTVTLDMDWGYSTGSITINASGALNGNSLMRGLAVSGGSLTVNGAFDVARVALYGGTAANSGVFQSDSLYIATTFTNNASGTINATQLLIYTGGNFTNNGATVSSNFLNMATVTSSGTISANDFLNSKTFTNVASGVMTMSHDFSNSDSLVTPALFTNNGRVAVYNDWANVVETSATVNGSGKFCVANNTYNSGTMSGTFDFCDQTGGNVDLNTGNIAPSITHCLFSCATGTIEHTNDLEINLFPNPNSGTFSIATKNVSSKMVVELYSVLGEKIYSAQMNSDKTDIDLSQQAKGIYFYQIKNENEILKSGKIIVE